MDPSLTEVERLLTADERRLTVAEHHSWQKSISSTRPFDEIDELVADLRETLTENDQ
jgi:hypothetical protein